MSKGNSMAKKILISQTYLQSIQEKITSPSERDRNTAFQEIKELSNSIYYLPKLIPILEYVECENKESFQNLLMQIAKTNIDIVWNIAQELIELLSHQDRFVRKTVLDILQLVLQTTLPMQENSYLYQETKRIHEKLQEWICKHHETTFITDKEIIAYIKTIALSPEERQTLTQAEIDKKISEAEKVIVKEEEALEREEELFERPDDLGAPPSLPSVPTPPPMPPFIKPHESIPFDVDLEVEMKIPPETQLTEEEFLKERIPEPAPSIPASLQKIEAIIEVDEIVPEVDEIEPIPKVDGKVRKAKPKKIALRKQRLEARVPEEIGVAPLEEKIHEIDLVKEIPDIEIEDYQDILLAEIRPTVEEKLIVKKTIFSTIIHIFKKIIQGLCFAYQWTKDKTKKGICAIRHYSKQFWHERTHPTRANEVSIWERLISDDAVHPGPLETALGKIKPLMKKIYYTIGLRYIILVATLDTVIIFFVAYVHGIHQSWKLLKTIHRRLQQRDPKKQLETLQEDLNKAKWQLANLYHFADFQALAPENQDIPYATFPLQTALNLRIHLDQMHQDLNFLTLKQVEIYAKNNLSAFLKSFIPNPMDILIPWKDLLLIALFSNYSREQIEETYVHLYANYTCLLEILATKNDLPNPEFEPKPYEAQMIQNLQKEEQFINSDLDKDQLMGKKEETQQTLQKIIQILCYPIKTTNPKFWQKHDLFHELSKTNPYLLFSLECELWLTKQVAEALREKMFVSADEMKQRYKEAKLLQKKYKLQQKIYNNT